MSVDIDRAVWDAVKRGDRKGTELSPGVVYARTGVRISHEQLQQAMKRLLAAGRLYWRSPRTQRRVLAGHWPLPKPEPGQDQPQPGLWELGGGVDAA